MSSMITNMISTLSLADKVSLNQVLAASIAKDLGASSSPILEKEKEKAKKAKDPNAPKKEAAPGVKAWNAFVKHCKTTQPQLFADVKLEKERLAICGSIKEKDLAAYQAWVAEFLKTLPASASAPASAPASDTEETEVKTKVKKEKTPEQKAADSQKRKEKAAAKKVSAATPAPAPAPAPEDDSDFIKKTIKGKNYLMDPASKNLYSTDDKFMSVGDYVGKFIPGDEAKPIDFDAAE